MCKKERSKKKKLILSCIIMFILTIPIFTIIFFNNKEDNLKTYKGLPVTYENASYRYDTTDPKIAVGVSDYVYIAKVNKILKTDYRNPIEVSEGLVGKKTVTDPYTIYEIEVIKNIKGTLPLNKRINLVQYGGLNENEKSYTFLEGGSLLENNTYYLLMSTIIPITGELETTDINRIIKISDYSNNKEVTSLINQYNNIYQNETIPEGHTSFKNKISQEYLS